MAGKDKKTEKTEKQIATAKVAINFRKEPDLQSEVLEVIPRYEKVKVIEKNGEWLKIIRNRKHGYVMAKFMRVME